MIYINQLPSNISSIRGSVNETQTDTKGKTGAHFPLNPQHSYSLLISQRNI